MRGMQGLPTYKCLIEATGGYFSTIEAQTLSDNNMLQAGVNCTWVSTDPISSTPPILYF